MCHVMRSRSVSPMHGILVLHHGPGVDRFMTTQVGDLEGRGYLVACPDLFHRQPDDGADTMTRIGRLRDDEILADVDAAIVSLRARGADKLAVLGFCMGGRNTIVAAGARPDVWSCAAVFYGGNLFTAWPADGATPFERVSRISCPVIGFFGNDDTNPSRADVERLDAALTEHRVTHTFHRYDGAGHAFLNFTNVERHRPTQAAHAWIAMNEFLERHLA